MDHLFENTINMPPAIKSSHPKWKVYFTGSFWGHHERDHAGTEIKINKQFNWAGYHWVIPAIYSCGKGLVLDLCMQVGTEKIRSFAEKWQLNQENDSYCHFTREQQMLMEAENPLCLDFITSLELNKKLLRSDHSCSVCFNPCFKDKISDISETNTIISHYGLDASFGWVIYRIAFAWTTKRRPELKTLSLTMKSQPKQIPGPHFKVHEKDDSFTFDHPVSGQTHTLTVTEIKQETIPQNQFYSDRLRYPTHFTSISYTLSPEPKEAMTILDFDESDSPLEIALGEDTHLPIGKSACAVSIIGGSYSPTSIVMFTAASQKQIHTACSALHFEPLQNAIDWHIIFNITPSDESTFYLI